MRNPRNGLKSIIPSMTKAIPKLAKPNRKNIGPRLGFAYRPFDNNRTVIRGGVGLYFVQYPGIIGPANSGNPPFGQSSFTYSTALPGKPTAPFLPDVTFSNPYPGGLVNSPNLHPNITAIQQNYRPGDTIVIAGEYEQGSTLNFYTGVPVHILHEPSANLWYGSQFPDAPPVFLSSARRNQ